MRVRILWRPPKALFIYPLQAVPRTAVLVRGFLSNDVVRVFDGWTAQAADFKPESIAATLPQLNALAGIVAVSHSAIVLRREWEPRLADRDRDDLWRAFRVPVFEQIIGWDRTLFATECEAHDGLHIESSKFLPEDHELDRSKCACGRTSPRLIDRQPSAAHLSRAAHAG